MARKELYELIRTCHDERVCPGQFGDYLWDNPDWNVYVSGGMLEKGVRSSFENQA